MEHLSSPEFIISCEHAGNNIPEDYESLFEGEDEVLHSHRGWDPGASELAQTIAKKTDSKLFAYPYTRLFVEPNRSIGHPILFSEFTRDLSTEKKQEIVDRYYLPYRNSVTDLIRRNASNDISAIHISVHTFTPVFDKKARNVDVGLLYDPAKKLEKDFCNLWKSTLKRKFPDFRIRMNQPYKGTSDGFTTFLRGEFDEKLYLGIELEINQKLYFKHNSSWTQICLKVAESLPSLSSSQPGN